VRSYKQLWVAPWLLGATLLGCGPGGVVMKELEGEWTRSRDYDFYKVSITLELEVDEAGEVDDCSYMKRTHFIDEEDPEYDYETELEADCKAEKESDGSLSIEFDVNTYTSEGEDMLGELEPSERSFRWDCSLLVEEEELECRTNGGVFYELAKD
jgi:hypothetical protein